MSTKNTRGMKEYQEFMAKLAGNDQKDTSRGSKKSHEGVKSPILHAANYVTRTAKNSNKPANPATHTESAAQAMAARRRVGF